MKDSKKQAYINTILKFKPKLTDRCLEDLEDKYLSALYKQCNILPSIVRTHPKDVKSFRRKLFKNKDLLFQDIGCICCIREQDNNSFEIEVELKYTKFESEARESMGYNCSAYARNELNKLFSDNLYYSVSTELNVNETNFWFWNKWGEQESESFMYLIIIVKDLEFQTIEKKIFTGEFSSFCMDNYYDKYYYALWLELNNGRCGYLSRQIIANTRSSVRFATRLEDVRRFGCSSGVPSYMDFFGSQYSDFKYIKKAEIVECKYKSISSRTQVV